MSPEFCVEAIACNKRRNKVREVIDRMLFGLNAYLYIWIAQWDKIDFETSKRLIT